MEKKILVAYASKYGATQGIAEKIGEVLRQAGLQANVISASQVNDLTSYKAVVLGSAVYIGQWRKEATTFLKTNEKLLSGMPVWLFSSGPTGEGDAVELMKGWIIPGSLKQIIERIKPKEITVFHGLIEAKKMNFLEKFAIKNVKAPLGDFRNWDAVTAWANGIGEAVKK